MTNHPDHLVTYIVPIGNRDSIDVRCLQGTDWCPAPTTRYIGVSIMYQCNGYDNAMQCQEGDLSIWQEKIPHPAISGCSVYTVEELLNDIFHPQS